jgi:hypothetical protein
MRRGGRAHFAGAWRASLFARLMSWRYYRDAGAALRSVAAGLALGGAGQTCLRLTAIVLERCFAEGQPEGVVYQRPGIVASCIPQLTRLFMTMKLVYRVGSRTFERE